MKIYRVNMTEGKVTTEDVKEDYAALGGRGLTSQIIADEVKPNCNPIGAKNKLVIAPGLLSGTNAPSSGRLSVGTKSPLTGGIKESNAGGTAAQKLAKLGVKAIVVEGKPKDGKFYTMMVNKNGVKLEDSSADLLGKGNYEVMEKMQKELGEDVSVMSIGQAGEYKLQSASIAVSDPEGRPTRHCGRGGTGAVMGSKGLKTIVIDDTDAPGVSIVDKDAFKKSARALAKALLDHPVCGEGLPEYGTSILINILNESGGLPTQNFRRGRFEGADEISGETIAEVINERGGNTTHACHPGCVMRCSQIYNDKDGNYLTGGFEYETIWGFGANSEVDDIDAIAKMDRICDDVGVDTIEMATTIGVAMEAGVIEFGDAEGAIDLLKEIGKGTPIGRIIGNGTGFTAKAFGVTRVPVVKNQGIPAYDPRAVKGVGVTYATSTMGADHTAGYAVTSNILDIGGTVDPLDKEGQIDLSRDLQIATAAVDSTGLCVFAAFAILDNDEALPAVVDMLNAQYGLELEVGDVTELGKSILKVERDFNTRAGFDNTDDRLPDFFVEEECSPYDVKFDITDKELDEVYDF
ncbi:aldehyde ferredoxin oxidoreductase family protein [Sporohalobacter salinus]|uniref:aldehyde ferredoxin oxidoreductase family protein n=1 Tax=Sporohalobacter salinus TaxID=1494606 RepID=UPI00195F868E|nr:aldehyde ferredoxin oxidoreductase C-terminal domain-containing protein [Sporohalobacter salinus]MBM7623365.1 aldehyde:ferredoxin oxidoreductase [Sporohalobacter salinus]